MAGRVPITVTVNGQLHAGEVEPRQLLVHFLRDTLGLTGTHVGCDTSNCGACTVHLDGDAVKSCTVLAVQADGAEVTTIEGMGREGDLHPLQEAFWEHHGLQCGYCTPGMIMAGADLLAKNPNPSEEEVREALAGNLCRCTGYHNIVKAVLCRRGPGGEAVSVTEEQANGTGKWVGQALRRKEDPRMITGRGRYVDDMVLPGMLYMAVVRSPEAHARIVSIDASGAKELPGVYGVFTGKDLDIDAGLPMAWVPPGVEIKTPEHWPLAKDEVNYVGQGVAVVLGDDKYGVVDAAEQVFVEYDPLPVVVDPEKALEEGSPLVHEDLGTNAVHEWSIGGGDMDAAWNEADVVLERRIVNHRTAGAPIEPRACIADYRGGQLTLHLTSQNPHLIRLFMAGEFGMSEDRIRVIAPDVGGGFGVKITHYGEEVLAAWASRKLGRPVKWTETRIGAHELDRSTAATRSTT